LFVQTNGSILHSSNIIVAKQFPISISPWITRRPSTLGTNQSLTGTGTIRPQFRDRSDHCFLARSSPRARKSRPNARNHDHQWSAHRGQRLCGLILLSAYRTPELNDEVSGQWRYDRPTAGTIHIAAPSTSANLDTGSDYLLFVPTSFTGSFNTAPVMGRETGRIPPASS
jgi:hypothetical protein